MTAPAPEPPRAPDQIPAPQPGPMTPEETPVIIIDLPPSEPLPGIPVDNPLPA